MPSVGVYGTKPNSSGCAISADRITNKVKAAVGASYIPIIEKIAFIADTFFMLKEMSFIGKMSGTSAISPAYYVRLLWIEENPGTVFDKTNNAHILQLIDLYLQLGLDWKEDPLIKHCMTLTEFSNIIDLNKYTVTFIDANQ
jgi:hypothetical protein